MLCHVSGHSGAGTLAWFGSEPPGTRRFLRLACVTQAHRLAPAPVWQGHRIAVIVPCHDEARLIIRMLRRVPDFVDQVIVVDDHSQDQTEAVVRALEEPRVRLLSHSENRGVGAAIVSGYLEALRAKAEILVVMAGDDQMDPADLPALLAPLGEGRADYVKGNRFCHPSHRAMPLLRRFAGHFLSFLTRRLTGLSVNDTQCGYTALSRKAALGLTLSELYPRYGYPNDLLAMLANAGHRVAEVPVRAVYADEKSGLRFYHVFVIIQVMLARRWRSRNIRAKLGRCVTTPEQC